MRARNSAKGNSWGRRPRVLVGTVSSRMAVATSKAFSELRRTSTHLPFQPEPSALSVRTICGNCIEVGSNLAVKRRQASTRAASSARSKFAPLRGCVCGVVGVHRSRHGRSPRECELPTRRPGLRICSATDEPRCGSMSDDELLSINEVARLWGTGLNIVVQLVEAEQLPSIDRGLLAMEGEYDIPLIRRSWAEALQRESPGASRTLPPPAGQVFHPAVEGAFDFHKALDLGDADGVFAASSRDSRENRTPDELLRAWQEQGSHLVQPGSGVGTTIYSLSPIEAVAARVMADAPTMPRAVTKVAPASMIDVLPLLFEDDVWRVDLNLFVKRSEWIQLLFSPLSGVDGSPSDASSSDMS